MSDSKDQKQITILVEVIQLLLQSYIYSNLNNNAFAAKPLLAEAAKRLSEVLKDFE